MNRRTLSRSMIAIFLVMTLLLAACGSAQGDAEGVDIDDGSAGAASGEADGANGAATSDDDGMEDGVVVQLQGESREDYIGRLYEAAQEEGGVTYYTSSGDKEVNTITESWGEMYPEVEMEPVTATSGTILERALLEVESGNVQADVYGGASSDAVLFEEAGALEEYRPVNEADIEAEEFLMDGPYVAVGYLSFHPAFNTELLDEAELPDDWMGYCDERWHGELAIDQEPYEWIAGILHGMGEEAGMAFLECLADNEPRLVRGSTNRTELLAAGEFSVMLEGYGHRLWQFEQEGAPVRAQRPSPEPLVTIPQLMMMFEDAPHPNAARLLLEFFVTPEGQEVFLEQNKSGTVSGNDHPYGELMEGVGETTLLGPGDADFEEAFHIFGDVFLDGASAGEPPAP